MEIESRGSCVVVALFLGLLLGGGATVLAARYNGVPTCSILDACENKKTIEGKLKKLESKLDTALNDVIFQHDRAESAVRELSNFKDKFNALNNDMKEIHTKINEIAKGEGDDLDRIKKETKYIREAMQRIDAYLSAHGGS